MRPSTFHAIASVVVVTLASGAAMAADKSRYGLFHPTPDSQLRDMSTDRPDKTESPITVDAGRYQIETDLVVYTRDRRHGTTTDTFDVLPFNLKAGLTHDTDLHIVYGAFSHVRASGGGSPATESGFGDLVLRLKHNLWGNDDGTTALAVMPFIKVPINTTADLDDDIEGGVIVPLAVDLGHGVGLGLMTEIDILRNESGGGYAAVFVNSAALSFALTDRLGMYVEAFAERSSESGAETIVTLGGGVTYAVSANLQLDAGANFGLTAAADDLNLLVGVSQRF